MRLIVFQTPDSDDWCTDCRDFCGTPPIGRGKTVCESIGDWMLKLTQEPVFWNMLGYERHREVSVTVIPERGYFRGDTWGKD